MAPTIEYVAAVAEIGTAVGTGALAAVTAWLARGAKDELAVVRKEADSVAEQAKATAHLAELTQQQMRQSNLPVVVPVIAQIGITQHGARNQLVTIVKVPVVNVGLGPALGLRLTLEWLDRDGVSSGPARDSKLPGKVGGLAPRETWDFDARFLGVSPTQTPGFRLELQFGDTFGTGYRVHGRYFPDEAAFRELELDTLDMHGVTASTITI